METQAHTGHTGLRGHSTGHYYPFTVMVKGLYPPKYHALNCLTGEESPACRTYAEAQMYFDIMGSTGRDAVQQRRDEATLFAIGLTMRTFFCNLGELSALDAWYAAFACDEGWPDDLIIWAPFENYSPEDVCEWMENMVNDAVAQLCDGLAPSDLMRAPRTAGS